ncbi:MAG: acyl-CoA thioesterase [Pseudomonadota bacterium]
MSYVFRHRARVYFDGTDAGGVMYHAHYLNLIEHARMEYFSSLGYETADLHYQHNLSFVAVECNMQWKRPAHLGDRLEITMTARDPERVSVWFDHEIYRLEPSGDRTLLNVAALRMVCVDAAEVKARSIPSEMKEKFLNGN